jgi:hypothetical protein
MGSTTFGAATALLAALLLMSTACGSPGREAVVTRDSAGIAMTLSRTPAWTPEQAWHLGESPSLALGGLIGQRHYDFTSIGDVRLLDDGRILVTHCSNPPEIWLYQADGSFVRGFAGEGMADGRCRFILRSWVAGPDTLVVYDPTLGRLTFFHMRGALLEVVPVGSEADGPIWIDRLDDGRLLGRPNNPQPSLDGRSRATFVYNLLDPGTLEARPLVEVDGAEFVVTGSGSDRKISQVLFAPFTAAVARGTTVYLSDTRDFWVDERDAEGALLRRFGRDFTPVVVDRRFVREYTQQRMAAAGSGARLVRQELVEAVFPDRLPAHEATMLVDAADHLWVLNTPGPNAHERRWSVFDPGGRWLGEVSVPSRLRVTQIAAARVVGVWREDADTQIVRIYDLIKP